jgi:hypothetical protein
MQNKWYGIVGKDGSLLTLPQDDVELALKYMNLAAGPNAPYRAVTVVEEKSQ